MEPPVKKHRTVPFTLSYPADETCKKAFGVEYLQGNIPNKAKKLLQDTKMFYLASKLHDTKSPENLYEQKTPVDYGPHLMRTLWADRIKSKEVNVVRTWPERDPSWSTRHSHIMSREFPARNLLSKPLSAEMFYVAFKRNP